MERKTITWQSESPEQTFDFGRTFAGILTGGDVVSLYGDLGSGKTLMAQGICDGLNVKEHVTSPSFTLMQIYQGRVPVYHFDFYRLQSPDDVEGLDVDTYFESEGISLVEWPEIGISFFPRDVFSVSIDREFADGQIIEGKRSFKVEGPDSRSLERLLA